LKGRYIFFIYIKEKIAKSKKKMASKCGCHGNFKFDEKELLRQIVPSLILGKFNKFGGSRLRTKV